MTTVRRTKSIGGSLLICRQGALRANRIMPCNESSAGASNAMSAAGRVQICMAILIAITACHGNRSRGDALRMADRYERGDGVTRDFRRAAELLEQSCDQGRGNPSACRRLAIAQWRGRGVPKQALVGPLVRHACEHGDWLACGVYVPFDEANAQAACDGRQPEACVALAALRAFSQSGEVELERRELLARACQRSVLEGCLRLVELLGDQAATEAPDAVERIRAECKRGDVDACAAAGTPIPRRELCAAGDHESC